MSNMTASTGAGLFMARACPVAPAGGIDKARTVVTFSNAWHGRRSMNVPGLCLPHRACGSADALRLALLAEQLGFTSVWVSELATYDAYALACAIAVRTERITIGTAIVPVSTRTPALHAMSMSTLAQLAP